MEKVTNREKCNLLERKIEIDILVGDCDVLAEILLAPHSGQ